MILARTRAENDKLRAENARLRERLINVTVLLVAIDNFTEGGQSSMPHDIRMRLREVLDHGGVDANSKVSPRWKGTT